MNVWANASFNHDNRTDNKVKTFETTTNEEEF